MTRVFAFDAYGTLFDVAAAIEEHRAAVGPDADAAVALWRQKQLEYTWVHTLMDRYEDFWVLTERALDLVFAYYPSIDPALRVPLLDAYHRLGAYPDVRPALERLRAEGRRCVVFTNGTPAMAQAALDAAGVGAFFERVVSVDALRRYKTHPAVYQHLCEIVGEQPVDVTLVSSNRWDVAGACSAGLDAIWCNRAGLPDEYPAFAPSRVIASLAELSAP